MKLTFHHMMALGMNESRETNPIRPALPEDVMRKFKYALLVMLVLGAATLADGIEVLRVEGIEVLSAGDSIAWTHVGPSPMGGQLRGVMVIDGIEVLVMEMMVPPEGGLIPMHFPMHMVGNRVELRDLAGEVLASDMADGCQND